MISIFDHNDIKIAVELSEDSYKDNLFACLDFRLGDDRLSNNNENNLSFFFVDCEVLELFLDNHETIQNPLFDLVDSEIIRHFELWQKFSDGTLVDEESSEVVFFNDNFFKNGRIFKSKFFDHLSIFFVADKTNLSFKYWDDSNPMIRTYDIARHDFISALREFQIKFEELNNHLPSSKEL
jgi:hypothetical protein